MVPAAQTAGAIQQSDTSFFLSCVANSLAGHPCYSTSLKRCREVSCHSVSLFKQSPEHHDGRGSCLALLGSDGVASGSVAIPLTAWPPDLVVDL